MKSDSIKTNISIRHLRAAIAVAELRSFTRAAEFLHVVPSALTETIRQLEADSGVSLFDRAVRPVSLTPAGTELIARARRIVADFDTAMLEMRRLGGLASGAVRVGAAPSMVRYPLLPAIASFRARHPAVEVTVFDDIAGRLGAMVRDRTIDFALAERWHETDELTYQPLLNDPFVLVCHSDHPLARERAVALSAIPEDDMIMLATSTGIGKLLAGDGILPSRFHGSTLRAHGTISMLIMISQGMGLALMPRLAASVLQSPQIVQVKLKDLALERELCIVTSTRTSLTPAAATLLAYLKDSLEAGEAPRITPSGRIAGRGRSGAGRRAKNAPER